jgi:hypothetical protein
MPIKKFIEHVKKDNVINEQDEKLIYQYFKILNSTNKFLIPKPKNNNRKFKLVFYYSNYSDQEIEFHLEKNDNIKTINLGKIQLHKI